MASKPDKHDAPRISNRRALHDYHIDAKLECGLMLVGTEVKVLRDGKAQLHDSFAKIENGELWLFGLHIDPYMKASPQFNHLPTRQRKLLVHKRELKRLASALTDKGTTLVPLSIYFKDGRAKVELAVARGKQAHDKRNTIKKKEMDRDLRKMTMKRG